MPGMFTLYATLAALMAGFVGGFCLQGLRWDASLKAAADARYSAVVKVRNTDADLQRIATARGASTEAQLQFQQEKARAIQSAINTRLAGLPACAVPGDVVGLLNAAAGRDALAAGAGPAGEPGPAQPPPDSARRADARAGDPGATGTPPSGTGRDAAIPPAGGERTYRDSTATAELAIAARNYAEVCIPNAIERDALRALYNEIRDRINGAVGRPP